MDRKLVSKQDHELDYLVRRWGVTRKIVRQARSAVGISRKKIVAWMILNDKIEPAYLIEFENLIA